MKRIVIFTLCIIMALSLVACDGGILGGGSGKKYVQKNLDELEYTLTVDGTNGSLTSKATTEGEGGYDVTVYGYQTMKGKIEQDGDEYVLKIEKNLYRIEMKGKDVAKYKKEYLEMVEKNADEKTYKIFKDLLAGKTVEDIPTADYYEEIRYVLDGDNLRITKEVENETDYTEYTYHENGALKSAASYDEDGRWYYQEYDENGEMIEEE